ncbi:tyrosine-protein phosphatase Lar-like [Stylophora pistillata]|uniref:tyrosine-protein phosphatase Lar-like n=1 Tax=Stylophora pistillata TaxID=50429 RepID=UPI000C03F3DC|nr:tyrosine-protein phosphatase Lar-like [Stylophora pistillata]
MPHVPSKPPTAFKLTASSSTSITASWQLPPAFARHGRNITGLKLFYKKKGSDGSPTTLTICNRSTLRRLVTGLDYYTEYQFQVLAFTSAGDGPKSSVEVERTMEDAPSQPPSNFTVTATSSTSVTASWQLLPANSRKGIIKGFKLFYGRKGSGVGTIHSINSQSTLNKNVTGLDKYAEYEFQVLAFTSVGDGPKSFVVVERTKEDVPSQPPRGFNLTATTSTRVTASWQLPLEHYRNGIIRGFKLLYKKKGASGPGSMQLIKNQTTRSQDITGLDKFSEYQFQILAFTSVGDGPNSTAIFHKTKEAAPSRPPSRFIVTVESPTSITASWQLPWKDSRHGIIKGFKLFYKKKDSGLAISLTIENGNTSTRVTMLDKFTEYEFQVLAFTSAGDGPNSSTVLRKTMEDAPSAPISLSSVDVPPSNLHGPRITLSWSKPTEPNGVIRSYTLFYSHGGGAPKGIPGIDKDTLRHTVDVLGGVTYRFHVRAVTIKPGANGTITVTTKEYKPSVGPDSLFSSQVNKTTFYISWEPLQKEMSYGRVTLYEVKANVWWTAHFHNWSAPNNLTANTSTTFVVLYDLMVCYKYYVSVRAYTGAGPGPYSEPLELLTSTKPLGELRATDYGTTHVALMWKHSERKESLTYTVNYNGTKFYDRSFKHVGAKKTNSTTSTVRGLFPGTSYKFEIYGSSDCGQTATKSVYITTHIMAPNSPLPLNMTDVEVSDTAVDIYLWPVEQENGPISAYQVVVLKVADGVEELPGNYCLQLKAASDSKRDNLKFYIAAEIENVPVIKKPWKFIVGDGEKTANYKNEILESGENYIVYQRALTKTRDVILEGKASKVAKITISPGKSPLHCNCKRDLQESIMQGDSFSLSLAKIYLQTDCDAKRFVSILDSFDLVQHVAGPTHRDGHTLDLVITRASEKELVSNCCVGQKISDHFAVHCSLALVKPSLERKVISYRKTRSIDFDKFRQDLANSSLLSDSSDHADLDALVGAFNDTLSHLVDSHAPLKTRTITIRPHSPWYTDEIATEKRKRRSLERRWRSSRLSSDYENYVTQCYVVNNMLRAAKVSYYGSIIEGSKHDQRVLFQTVEKLLHTKPKPQYPTSCSDADLANKFADFFTEKIVRIQNSLDSPTSTPGQLLDVSPPPDCVLLCFETVTEDHVASLITSSAIKCCPLDPAPAVILKECVSVILPVITKIVNLSINSCVVPDCFKLAMLNPLLKKMGLDFQIFANFRPISNLMFLSKLSERVVAVQLINYVMTNDLGELFQSAYKQLHSTET